MLQAAVTSVEQVLQAIPGCDMEEEECFFIYSRSTFICFLLRAISVTYLTRKDDEGIFSNSISNRISQSSYSSVPMISRIKDRIDITSYNRRPRCRLYLKPKSNLAFLSA